MLFQARNIAQSGSRRYIKCHRVIVRTGWEERDLADRFENFMRTTASNRCNFRRWVAAAVLLTTMDVSSAVRAVDLIGYLPYYRMNASYNANTLPDQLPLLDEIRYFGLEVSNSGMIVPGAGSGSMADNLARIATIKQAIAAIPADRRPRLDITLGGPSANQQANFAAVAASADLRTALAQQVDSLLDETGATSVDTDWEHPDPLRNNFAEVTVNYRLMLNRIKNEIGPERRVYATVDPIKMVPPSVFDGADGIDGISLMTYELAWWAGDPNDHNRGEHSLPEYVEDSVNAWIEPAGSQNDRPYVFAPWGNNTAAEKLGIGMPFFGRVIGTSQNPMSGMAYTYSELANGGTTSDGNYYSYHGQTVWIPGPDLVEQRVQFAHDRGLKNIIIWEIGQDLHPDNPDSLLRRAYEKNQTFLAISVPGDYDGNGSVGPEDYALWKATFGATSGDMRADGNLDNVIDAADYTFWRDRVSDNTGSDATNGVALPEPRTSVMFSVFVAYSFLYSRRGGRSFA